MNKKFDLFLGRNGGHQKDPQREDKNKEENESADDSGESSEEEESEETDEEDEDKLLDDPDVKECIAVGNFNAQQEGDLTFMVSRPLQKNYCHAGTAGHSVLNSSNNYIPCFWDSEGSGKKGFPQSAFPFLELSVLLPLSVAPESVVLVCNLWGKIELLFILCLASH